jgi:hypothetical protein
LFDAKRRVEDCSRAFLKIARDAEFAAHALRQYSAKRQTCFSVAKPSGHLWIFNSWSVKWLRDSGRVFDGRIDHADKNSLRVRTQRLCPHDERNLSLHGELNRSIEQMENELTQAGTVGKNRFSYRLIDTHAQTQVATTCEWSEQSDNTTYHFAQIRHALVENESAGSQWRGIQQIVKRLTPRTRGRTGQAHNGHSPHNLIDQTMRSRKLD